MRTEGIPDIAILHGRHVFNSHGIAIGNLVIYRCKVREMLGHSRSKALGKAGPWGNVRAESKVWARSGHAGLGKKGRNRIGARSGPIYIQDKIGCTTFDLPTFDTLCRS